MKITATHLNYYHVCHRKLWLFANGITMEHTSDLVSEGKLIGTESYPQRAERWTEVEIDGSKIDFFDPKNGVVHEIKKSDAKELAHITQVQYYLYLLRRNGIEANYGTIEYPKLRQTERVELSDEDIAELERKIVKVQQITSEEFCPPTLPKSKCRNCSYFDFCHTVEE